MSGHPTTNDEPGAASIITADLDRFWVAVDRAGERDMAGRISAFRDLYLRSGSPGLRDWMRHRLSGVEDVAATRLARITADRARFYAGFRATVPALDSTGPAISSIRDALRRLKTLYPEGVFPDVYLLIGDATSRGTVGPSGVLIGAEMFCGDEPALMDELDPWQRENVGSIRTLAHTVAHEWVHYQQPRRRRASTLLEQALLEGAADLIAVLVTGMTPSTDRRMAYGRMNEAVLWREFRRAMYGRDTRAWLYQGTRAETRPADLGYFVGYRICESLYERIGDQRAAVRQLISWQDADRLLRDSRYPSS